MIVDDRGNAIAATNPTGGVRAWHLTHIDGAHQLRAVSCPSTELCVAADNAGHVIVGTALPSRAAVRALLRKLLTPSGNQVKIRALLRNHGYRFSVRGPSAGKLIISWHTRARSAKAPLLVASAHARLRHSGVAKVRLGLTNRGSQLLRQVSRLKLTAHVRFTPTGGAAATTQNKTITLTS